MSAAEKLRALDALISREPSNADWGWDDDEIGSLRNALPQIVAAVEALEHIQEPLLENPPMNDYERFVAKRSGAALAALDKALT